MHIVITCKMTPTEQETVIKIALKYAEAVLALDTEAGDPEGAVKEYTASVSLLSVIINDLYRDGTVPEKAAVMARFVTIHNNYLDRVAGLCAEHGIPMPAEVSSSPPREAARLNNEPPALSCSIPFFGFLPLM